MTDTDHPIPVSTTPQLRWAGIVINPTPGVIDETVVALAGSPDAALVLSAGERRRLAGALAEGDRPDLDAIAARVDAATDGPWHTTSDSRAILTNYPHPPGVVPPQSTVIVEDDTPDGPRAEDMEFIAAARTAVDALVAEVRGVTAVRDRYWKALESARRRAHRWSVRSEKATRDAKEAAQSARDSAGFAEKAWGEVDKLRAELATARREERERCAAAIEGHVTVVRASNDRKSVGCYRRAQNTIRALPDEGTPTGPREYRLAGPVLTPTATGTTHTVLPLAGDHGDASLVLPNDYDRADLAQAVLGDHSSPEAPGFWQRLLLSELLDISDDEDSLDTPNAAMWETAYTAACRARARAYGDTPKAQPAEASPHECGATWEPTGTGATYVCTQRPGHQGAHQSPSDARWLDVSPNATPARTTTEET